MITGRRLIAATRARCPVSHTVRELREVVTCNEGRTQQPRLPFDTLSRLSRLLASSIRRAGDEVDTALSLEFPAALRAYLGGYVRFRS